MMRRIKFRIKVYVLSFGIWSFVRGTLSQKLKGESGAKITDCLCGLPRFVSKR